MRIDSALTPPGLIASARMYSLFVKDDGLYIIYTGKAPASQADYSKGLQHLRQRSDILKNAAVTKLIDSYIRKIQKVEQELNKENLETYLDGKFSFFIPLNEVEQFKAEKSSSWVDIRFRHGKKKFKFHCSLLDEENLKSFISLFESHSNNGK